MTTFDRTNNQSSASNNAPSLQYGRTPVTVEAIVDFSATGNAHATSDVFKVIQVPKGYMLLQTGSEVLTADTAGNSGTIQLGLGASTRGSAVAPSSTGFSASAWNGTLAAPSATDAYIQATIGTGAINAVVRVFATYVDVRGKPGTPVCIGAGPGNYAAPSSYTFGAEIA